MRLSGVVVAAIMLISVLPTVSCAWNVLDRFKGDTLYMAYDISYMVRVSASGASGVALGTYTLHIVVEKLNRTHYVVSALAGNVTYSLTSSNLVFLHVLAQLFITNLSKYFVDLLYVPPTEGVTVGVVLPKDSIPLFLNAVARWYKIVEDTSGEVCQEIRVGNITVGSGVRYRMLTPRAELVYDCSSGILVSLSASIHGGIESGADVTMRVELSKLNFLNLTSIRLPAEKDVIQERSPTIPVVLLASSIAAFAVVLALTVVVFKKLKEVRAGSPGFAQEYESL
ncbi:MAG: hypothetical protein QW780_01050 [Sulfolobales archaeon]